LFLSLSFPFSCFFLLDCISLFLGVGEGGLYFYRFRQRLVLVSSRSTKRANSTYQQRRTKTVFDFLVPMTSNITMSSWHLVRSGVHRVPATSLALLLHRHPRLLLGARSLPTPAEGAVLLPLSRGLAFHVSAGAPGTASAPAVVAVGTLV